MARTEAGDEGDHDGHQQDVADALVEHGVGVGRRLARGHHHLGHRLAAEDPDAEGHDAHREEGRGDAHERDADGQPAAQQGAAAVPASRLAHALGSAAVARTVAHAADGHDVARLLGVVAELVAQPADVDVDGAVEDVALARAVDGIEQLVARERPPVGGHERHQEPELHGRERAAALRRGGPRSAPCRWSGRAGAA